MGTFFQAFGILALVIVVLVLAVVAVIVWKFKKFMRGLAGAATPATIQLEPTDEPEWDDDEKAQAQTSQLTELGFLDAGAYTIPAMGGIVLRGFVKPADGSVACIYEHPAAGLVTDLVTRYPDRTSITVTDIEPTGVDAPPGKTRVHLAGSDAGALYERMLAERPPNKTPRRYAASEFARHFEQSYAEEMAWRKGRGGATKDEIRRVAAKSGTQVSEEQIEQAQRSMRKR